MPLHVVVFSEGPANLSSARFFTALAVSLFNSHLIRLLTAPAIPSTADTSEVGKDILTLPVAKPRYNTEVSAKTYELSDYSDIHCITHACRSEVLNIATPWRSLWIPFLNFLLYNIGDRGATNRKVAGSFPVGVIGIFHWHKILPIALWHWGRFSL